MAAVFCLQIKRSNLDKFNLNFLVISEMYNPIESGQAKEKVDWMIPYYDKSKSRNK